MPLNSHEHTDRRIFVTCNERSPYVFGLLLCGKQENDNYAMSMALYAVWYAWYNQVLTEKIDVIHINGKFLSVREPGKWRGFFIPIILLYFSLEYRLISRVLNKVVIVLKENNQDKKFAAVTRLSNLSLKVFHAAEHRMVKYENSMFINDQNCITWGYSVGNWIDVISLKPWIFNCLVANYMTEPSSLLSTLVLWRRCLIFVSQSAWILYFRPVCILQF